MKITRTSVRVAFASTLTVAALAGGVALATPAVAAPTSSTGSTAHVVVFDDDQVRGLDRCTVLERDNLTRCTVLPTAVLNRLVVEQGLDRSPSAPAAAEGLSVSMPDPRWR